MSSRISLYRWVKERSSTSLDAEIIRPKIARAETREAEAATVKFQNGKPYHYLSHCYNDTGRSINYAGLQVHSTSGVAVRPSGGRFPSPDYSGTAVRKTYCFNAPKYRHVILHRNLLVPCCPSSDLGRRTRKPDQLRETEPSPLLLPSPPDPVYLSPQQRLTGPSPSTPSLARPFNISYRRTPASLPSSLLSSPAFAFQPDPRSRPTGQCGRAALDCKRFPSTVLETVVKIALVALCSSRFGSQQETTPLLFSITLPSI